MVTEFQTMPLLISLVGSMGVYFAFALTYNTFVGAHWNVKDPPVMVAHHALRDPNFWAALFVGAVLALLPRSGSWLLWLIYSLLKFSEHIFYKLYVLKAIFKVLSHHLLYGVFARKPCSQSYSKFSEDRDSNR